MNEEPRTKSDERGVMNDEFQEARGEVEVEGRKKVEVKVEVETKPEARCERSEGTAKG
jgi:hypothetical protein